MSSGLSLVLVRHGETEWMTRGRLHGRLDSPLNPAGLRHAEQAAQRLSGETFDALYSSPLGRAMETAAILARQVRLTPLPLPGLAELDFGWLEGASAPLWHEGRPMAIALRPVRALVHRLSGEPPAAFRARVASSLAWITQRHPQGRLLLVAHWAVFSQMLGLMLNQPASEWRRNGPWTACGISEVRRTPADDDGGGPGWEVVRLNDISHLDELEAV